MHSKQKGMVGEAKILQTFLENDFAVFTEFGDLSRIDLIVVKGALVLKVQVKACTSKNGKVVLYSKKSGPNYSFSYRESDVDIFAVYILDKEQTFFVSSKELCSYDSSMSVRLEETKNGQARNCNFIEDYTLARILRDYTPNTEPNHVDGDDIVQTTTN